MQWCNTKSPICLDWNAAATWDKTHMKTIRDLFIQGKNKWIRLNKYINLPGVRNTKPYFPALSPDLLNFESSTAADLHSTEVILDHLQCHRCVKRRQIVLWPVPAGTLPRFFWGNPGTPELMWVIGPELKTNPKYHPWISDIGITCGGQRFPRFVKWYICNQYVEVSRNRAWRHTASSEGTH